MTTRPVKPQQFETKEPGRGRIAAKPQRIPSRGWRDIAWRTFREISRDRLTIVAGGVTFYTLPDILVNIQAPDGRPTFLKLKLTLEMHDAAVAEHLQAEMPRMQDMFQGFLRELRPEDLAGSAGSFQLRAEILRRVNLIAAPGKVDAVLIEEMLVQ